MLDLDSLTCVAKSNILDNIPLHFVAPIDCLDIMVYLIPSWMNRISELVSFSKYLVLQPLDVRHANPSFIPQHTLVVFHKSEQIFFLDITFYLLDLLVFHLTSLNIPK
jgi:hypothetical protein